MTYEAYSEKKLRGVPKAMVEIAAQILEEYEADGYTLTLRQLYYQFVARDILKNTERNYQNLSSWITSGRMVGLISWDAIEDRGRVHEIPYTNTDPVNILSGIEYSLAHDYWLNQDVYIEVWVEKDALIGVVERPARKWKLPHLACRGYMSASAAYRAGKRFEEAQYNGKHCVLLHLGDHDPSGIDMTRDNHERVELFSGYDVEVRRLALNYDQVEQYNPPPNPTKPKDSRTDKYRSQFGSTCWELDALKPQVIAQLIEDAVQEYIDPEKWEQSKMQESVHRASSGLTSISRFPQRALDWGKRDRYRRQIDV